MSQYVLLKAVQYVGMSLHFVCLFVCLIFVVVVNLPLATIGF